MRLTLRTLLAYLDNTLDPDDATSLQQKIEESSFATSLVSRIRATMDHRELGATAPDAVGPLENANVIGEYLDSTLAPEQIAEIERFCLESDVSLAEVAACHQILSVALRQPTLVPDALRERIHRLPDSDQLQKLAAGHSIAAVAPTSYASLEIPSDDPGISSTEPLETEPMSTMQLDTAVPKRNAAAIAPVGPDDSGVTKAPTRLREVQRTDSERDDRVFAVNAVRAAQHRGESYGGLIRPSRITPWLVSLALAGVFLLAIGQLFQPLLQRRAAKRTADADQVVAPEKVTPSKVGSVASSGNTTTPQSTTPESTVPESTVPEPALPDTPVPNVPGTEMPVPNVPAPETPLPEVPMPEVPVPEVPMPETPVPEVPVLETTMEPTGEPSTSAPDANDSPPEEMTPPADPVPEGEAMDKPEETMPTDDLTITPTPSEATEAAETPATTPVATFNDRTSLLVIRDATTWSALTLPIATETDPEEPVKAPEIPSDKVLMAPPLYRPVLVNESENLEWTIIGPAQWRLIPNPDGRITTQLIDGRMLLASTGEDAAAILELGGRRIRVEMPVAQTVLAVELVPVRTPGMNPLIPENRILVSRILSVQGQATLSTAATDATPADESKEAVTLASKDQWLSRGDQPAVVSTLDRFPDWIDTPEKSDLLVTTARDGILDFVRKGPTLERSLMEAMQFRRAEVVALAAETLLSLGRADAYFGIDGILSAPRQRLYWTEHFQRLRHQINIGAEDAEQVRMAVMKAELADGDAIFKLIVGFSNEELAAGGDAELIAMLNSNSMSVRVLAIENLRTIIGDTLGYRADEENAIRRAPEIKKWEARLRKGDIRYKEQS